MSSRSDFNESWLNETPAGIGKIGNSFFNTLVHSVTDYISHGLTPTELSNGFKKIFGQQVAYYWHEDQGMIDLVMELSVTPQSLIVNGVAKNPKGSSVYASDLYELVLSDNHKSLRLMSDEQLSDNGLSLWKRLLNLGHTISVYDREDPSKLIKLNSDSELDQYFQKRNNEYRRYQYVLSESMIKLAETNAYFNTRLMRKLAGLETS